MKKMGVVTLLFSLALTLCVFGVANATLLTFDDIGVPGTVYPPHTQTGFVDQGFRFSNNSDVVDISVSSPFAFSGPAYSGNYAALNDYYGTMEVTKDGGGTFSVQDFFIRGWDGIIDVIVVSGLLNGSPVGSVSINMTDQWQNVVLNFANIDTLAIAPSAFGLAFLVDNLTVNATAVPEPSTMLLLGSGLLGLWGFRKKLKK